MTMSGLNEVTGLLRKDLAAAFPGVVFRVFRARGTGAAHATVSWTDGPDEQAVRAVAHRWLGRDFDGQTDTHRQREPLLVAVRGRELPRQVSSPLDGIGYSRKLSPAALWEAQTLVNSVYPELSAYTPDGRETGSPSAQRFYPDTLLSGEFLRESTGYGMVRQAAVLIVLPSRDGDMTARPVGS